jgi:hypothetical protein
MYNVPDKWVEGVTVTAADHESVTYIEWKALHDVCRFCRHLTADWIGNPSGGLKSAFLCSLYVRPLDITQPEGKYTATPIIIRSYLCTYHDLLVPPSTRQVFNKKTGTTVTG